MDLRILGIYLNVMVQAGRFEMVNSGISSFNYVVDKVNAQHYDA